MDNPKKPGPINVLLVDDSQVALLLFNRILSRASDIRVVGTARNGKEALELIPRLEPTVICTDLHMPVMNGLEFTREVMARYPRPILLISVSVQEGSQNVFQVLDAGAVDVFVKPRSGLESEFFMQADDLIRRIRILAGVHVFRKVHPAGPPKWVRSFPERVLPRGGIAIGASTGGPQALHGILGGLPRNFPAPIFCVQHIGEGFLQGLVDWLQSISPLQVGVAREGDFPIAGRTYFPPEGTHLELTDDGRFLCSRGEPLNGHRPSINVTFRSVARYFGRSALGVLLTGMGEDGAEGLKAIRSAGGTTIVQDEATSAVFSMPRRALESGAAQQVLPLEKIDEALAAWASRNG